MLTILRDAWKDVEKCYKKEEINSEHCLQAVLYHALRFGPAFPPGHVILVEPRSLPLDDGISDLLIRDREAVKCILEIKCAPHDWLKPDKLRRDLQKLAECSRIQGAFELDIFGPDRYFDHQQRIWQVRDLETREWQDGRGDKFEITKDTWIAFASLTRDNDRASKGVKEIESFCPEIKKIPRFCLLSGAMDPKKDICRFTCESRDGEGAQVCLHT